MIGHGLKDRQGRVVTLREIGEDWQQVADVAPRDDQRGFVPALAAHYLLVSTLGATWHSFGVHADEEVVGHIMWGIDDDDSRWIGGVLIDASQQGQGLGRAATATMLRWLSLQEGCRVVRLSYQANNTVAAALYASMGFTPNGEMQGDEIIAERPTELG
ncbi:MAG: GNAT family N-acetyltransferase [Aeromicrobium sp.]